MQNIINFVGIDMAKNDFYACLSDVIEPQKFNNDMMHPFFQTVI